MTTDRYVQGGNTRAEDYFIYIPAPNVPRQNASNIQFGNNRTHIIRNVEGLGQNYVKPQAQKAPYQIGETFINTDIEPRFITMDIRIVASDRQELNTLRNQLSASLIIEPQIDEIPQLGVLQYWRQGFDPFEILCCPTKSPQFETVEPEIRVCDASVEFYCPYPYWRSITIINRFISNPEKQQYQESTLSFEDWDAGTQSNIVILPNIEGNQA